MKFTELKKFTEESISKKTELEQHIAELQEREQIAKENAQAAAEAGSVVAYKSATTEAQNIGIELVVAKAQYKKLQEEFPVSRKDADAAWKDYAADYNRRFGKLYSDFQAKREELLKIYGELYEMQRQACEDREWLAQNCGSNTKFLNSVENPFDAPFPCRTLPSKKEGGAHVTVQGTNINDPDAVYYLLWLTRTKNLSGYNLAAGDGDTEIIKNVIGRRTTIPF